MRKTISMLAVLALAGAAQAQAIDGQLTPGDNYGAPVFTQAIQTGFGTAPNGSELAAIYCKSDATHVTLFFAGSLEANFNKFNVFFDTRAGGQNQIGGTNPNNDNWSAKHNGLTFDQGFAADYMMIFRRGFAGDVNSNVFDVDFAELGGTNGGSLGRALTNTPNGTLFNNTIGTLAPFAAVLGYTSSASSIGGTSGSAVAAGQQLLSLGGIELRIPLAALGLSAGQTFLLSAGINGSNHDFLSNQIAGSLPVGTNNLGGDGNGTFTGNLAGINFNNFAGDQFVLVPAPGALALLGLGGLVASRRRRA